MTAELHRKRANSPTVELLKATAKGKLFRVIEAINEGAQLAVNKNGHNALHIASYKGFLDIVRILLSAGCEVDGQDDKGDTALHRACIAGHDLIVARLLEEGCSVDRQNQLGDTALHEAACRGYSRCVKALIMGRANIGLKNKNMDTATHLACANSHSGSLRLLLSYYPHSSPKNAQGDTPLHVAVRFGHVTCARVLISARCNVNLQNKIGNTSLHIATIAKHRKLVRILLDAGALPRSPLNNERKSAFDIAKENDDGETAFMLLSGGRKTQKSERVGRKAHKASSHRRNRSEPRKGDVNDGPYTGQTSSSGGPRNAFCQRPRSDSLPRKRYMLARAKYRRHERRKIEKLEKSTDLLEEQQHKITVNPFVVPQLYSLYRDCHGDVRQEPVIDHLPNPTPEVVSSLANVVENSKGELLEEMKKTNHLLESRINQLESSTAHKVAKLDQITKERIHAERMRCLHRIDRRAMLEREVLKSKMENCGNASVAVAVVRSRDNKKDASNSAFKTSGIIGFEKQAASAQSDYKGIETKVLPCIPGAFSTLEPYRTIKIGRDCNKTMPACIHTSCDGKSCMATPGSVNYSDSAYGSLSPRHTVNSTSLSRCQPKVDERSSRSNSFREYKSVPTGCQKLEMNNSERDPDVLPEFTQEVFTREVFENVTHAMEEWYEKRLREATEKQSEEMNQKVAELENKMRNLQCSLGSNESKKLPPNRDFEA